ncbi:major facilitator superfamily domain-containing protein [Xylogone sp. PMI_703]|nr:major facilitator superfamily domain-containing protein [Xylogone sp. PMI_703]
MGKDDVEADALALGIESVPSKQELEMQPKLDPHGYLLRPQPSDDPLDPLNWSPSAKMAVLLQVSFLGLLGGFGQGTINSAFALLAPAMGVNITVASYSTTVAIVFAGVFPLVYSPVANLYGMGIGASVVADLYFTHERGKYMGIYILFVTNGAHIAALVGGFTAKYAGWRWCYWVPTIVYAVAFALNVFALPETLYRRDPVTGVSHERTQSRWQLFNFRGVRPKRRLTWWDVAHVFLMTKYPSVLLGGLYYCTAYGVGSVLFAITGSAAFHGIYNFDTAQVGLAVGLALIVGSILGELVSGSVSDLVLLYADKRAGGHAEPEARLHATWPGAFLLPAGVIIEGVCLQYKTHWFYPCFGIGVGAFGLQIVSTTLFAYLADCYKPQSAEVSTLLNFFRLTFSFTVPFYAVPFAEATTYGIAWTVFAIINAVLYVNLIILMWKGAEWRKKLGKPDFDKDL